MSTNNTEIPVVATAEIPKSEGNDEATKLRMAKQRGRRSSVSAECGVEIDADEFKKVKIEKTESQYERIRKSVESNFLFTSLDEDQREDVFDAMAEKHVKSGTTIIQQNDEGDFFYVLDSGVVNVIVDDNQLLTYSSGASFGELALMYNTPRSATVVAAEDCTLWTVDRDTFRHILYVDKSKKRQQYEGFLQNCELFSKLSIEEVQKVADVLEEYIYEPGAIVLRQGQEDYESMKFYIVEEGEAEAYQVPKENLEVKEDDGTAANEHGIIVGVMKVGDFFGEKALIEQKPRAATVVAKTKLKVAALGVSGFERLMGPCKDLMRRTIDTYTSASVNAHPAGQGAAAARAISKVE